jgi:transposase
MLRTKQVREITRIIDDIIEHYKETSEDKKRDWRTYEQKFAERIKTAMRELSPLIEEAIKSFKVYKGETRGTKPKLILKQKVILLLLKHLFGKSNRTMSNMLVVFSLLTDVDVSYRTVERLYSDNEVRIALHNLHQLILRKKGIKEANCGGDGTGYSLTVRKHYSSETQKLKEKVKIAKKVSDKKRRVFVYSFAFMDIKTRMYIAYGSSFHSEQEAFLQAIKMAKEINIKIKKIRMDKYYSKQIYVKLLEEAFGDIEVILMPKSNATVRGPIKWKEMLSHLVIDPVSYLEEYFQRNQSESGIAEDKRRTGWRIMQKRRNRIDTANFCTSLWHNLFWYGD